MIKEKIKQSLIQSLEKTQITFDPEKIFVKQTDSLEKGDYTTNISMQLASIIGTNPRELAQTVVENIDTMKEIQKVEVAGPGFINFYLSDKYLLQQIKEILDKGGMEYIKSGIKEGKNILIEYTDANPFKVFHIGHLYTNAVGESFSRLQETTGANVKRANYQGDIGLHVAKTMWGIKYLFDKNNQSFEDIENLDLSKKVEFLGEAYMTGAQYYDDIEDDDAIEEIQSINYYLFQSVYSSIPKKEFKSLEGIGIDKWYQEGRQWCLDQFETLYDTLGTKFDYMFFESKAGEIGYQMVKENIGKIFREDQGAVIYEGDPNKGLHTRVFINKFGLPTYEAKEIGLAKEKSLEGIWDESIMITDKTQSSYFKVVFDVLGKLLPQYAKTVRYIPHGVIALPGMKKMSSRKGEVVSAEKLLNSTKEAVKNIIKDNGKEANDETSMKIAIGAIKYAFLRVTVGRNIAFDVKKDIQVDGDTGPYLMYVYTRATSILNSVEDDALFNLDLSVNQLTPHTKSLMRDISRVSNVVLSSSIGYSPSTLCTYLFELGQTFNHFYQEVNVLNANEDEKPLLLAIVKSTAEIMKTGLYLLGIETVERM